MRFLGFGGGRGGIFVDLPSGVAGSADVEFLRSGLWCRDVSILGLIQFVRDGDDNFCGILGSVATANGAASCSAIGSQFVGLIGNIRADFGVEASANLLRDSAELPSTVVRRPKLSYNGSTTLSVDDGGSLLQLCLGLRGIVT